MRPSELAERQIQTHVISIHSKKAVAVCGLQISLSLAFRNFRALSKPLRERPRRR